MSGPIENACTIERPGSRLRAIASTAASPITVTNTETTAAIATERTSGVVQMLEFTIVLYWRTPHAFGGKLINVSSGNDRTKTSRTGPSRKSPTRVTTAP